MTIKNRDLILKIKDLKDFIIFKAGVRPKLRPGSSRMSKEFRLGWIFLTKETSGCHLTLIRHKHAHLPVYETEEGNADLHAQVMQAKDGRLQQEEANGEEKAQAQGQVVPLAPLRSVGRVKRGNDSAQKLRLHSLGSLLHQMMGKRDRK